MDSKRYMDFLLSLGDLKHSQLRHLAVRVQEFLEKDEVNCAIEKRQLKLTHCIFCKSSMTVRWGHSSGLQRFRCKQCRHTFNELSGSPFAKLQLRQKLGTYAQCMVNGLTLRQAAHKCDIALSTSFQWRHKFLQMPEQHKSKILSGIVEADETFFRESFKGKRTITHRKPRHHGRLKKGEQELMVPVLLLLDRTEHEADFVLKRDNREEIYPCIQGRIKPGSVLCTDGSQIYAPIAEEENLVHKRILRSNPARTIENGLFHIQTLNNYIARLKGWLNRFYGVGTQYLGNYLAWWRILADESLLTIRDWLNEALSS